MLAATLQLTSKFPVMLFRASASDLARDSLFALLSLLAVRLFLAGRGHSSVRSNGQDGLMLLQRLRWDAV